MKKNKTAFTFNHFPQFIYEHSSRAICRISSLFELRKRMKNWWRFSKSLIQYVAEVKSECLQTLWFISEISSLADKKKWHKLLIHFPLFDNIYAEQSKGSVNLLSDIRPTFFSIKCSISSLLISHKYYAKRSTWAHLIDCSVGHQELMSHQSESLIFILLETRGNASLTFRMAFTARLSHEKCCKKKNA